MKIDFTLLGLGRFSEKRIVPILNSCPSINFNSIISSKSCTNRFSKNVNFFANLDSFLETNKNGVIYICSPNYLHYEHSIKCLEHGLNVLCEKPIGISSEQAEKLIQTAKKVDRNLVIGHMLRFSPIIEKVKEILKNNELGNVLDFNLIFNYELPENARKWSNDWQKSGGGALIDAGVHCIDFLQMVFGEGLEVESSQLDIINGDTHRVDSKADFTIISSDGVKGTISLNSKTKYMTSFRILGSKANLIIDNFAISWGNVDIRLVSKNGKIIIKNIQVDNSNLYRDQIESFAKACIFNRSNIIDTKALKVMKMIEKIYKINISS